MTDSSLSAKRSAESMTLRGWNDIVWGLWSWRIWHLLGIGSLRRRYARSRLGQFWTTVTMAVMVIALGFTWSILWRLPLHDILPYIAASLILWYFITGVITDATNVMIGNGNYFLNQNMSFSTPIYAVIYYQLINLAHNAVILLIVYAIFPRPLGWNVLFFFPGFLLTLITLLWVACVIAVMCARYRDVIQLVTNIVQIAIYITPVMYKATFIPAEYQWLNLVNPFAVFLSITRDPLIGLTVSWQTWAVALLITFGGVAFTLPFVGRFRKRVLFWI